MEIIDAQLHELGPRLSWNASQETRFGILTEVSLAWMDAVGIDIAIINIAITNPHDEKWIELAIEQYPERYAAVMTTRDPQAEGLETTIAKLRSRKNVFATRTSFGRFHSDPTGEIGLERLRSGEFERLFSACEEHEVPLFAFASGNISAIPAIVEAHPNLMLIVDHVGMPQPPHDELESPVWGSLSALCSLAQYKNVAVKLCGLPVLSDEDYPFRDVWPHVRRILDAFGPERVMWASDIGRFQGRIGWENRSPQAKEAYKGKHTYAESLHLIRESGELSEREKELLLGGAARRVLRWPSPP